MNEESPFRKSHIALKKDEEVLFIYDDCLPVGPGYITGEV